MEAPRRNLEDEKIEIEWCIQDFNTTMAIADACGSSKAMQFETNYCQKKYAANPNLDVENRWVFFLRKPKVGGGNKFSMGVRREILNFHEGHQNENPFGMKVTFRVESPEDGDNVVLTESEMFSLSHEESKKWEVGYIQALLDATDFELLSMNLTLEIFTNPWHSETRARDIAEAAFLEEEAQHARAALSAFFAQPDLPFADFSLKVVDGDETFKVNRCIVGAMSPVFKTMFENPMFVEGQERCVTIVDLTADAVRHLLTFIYGGDLTLNAERGHRNENGKIIMELVYAADKYELPSLKMLCDIKLQQFFTHHNAYEMLDLCEIHGLPLSTPRIEKYVDENILLILQEKSKQIRAAEVAKLATADNMELNESE